MQRYSIIQGKPPSPHQNGCIPMAQLRLGLVAWLGLIASAFLPSTSFAEPRSEIPVHLFLSPSCSISRSRLVEMSPRLDEITLHGGKLTYVVIPFDFNPAQIKLARQLFCADKQGRFVPFFLYASSALWDERPIPMNTLVPALGLDRKQFNECMTNIPDTGAALLQGYDLYVEKKIQGVPLALVARQQIASANIDSIVAALESAPRDPTEG